MSIERRPPIEVLEDQDKMEDHECLVRTAFSLSNSEIIVGEYPCYLVKLVTLPGWMYLTNERICFFAPLPGEEDAPRKAGYLTKKNPKTSLLTSRYYFILQHDVLVWYGSAETHYQPLGSINLKTVSRIQETTRARKQHGFELWTPTGRHTFFADSEVSKKEWVDDLQRTMFMAKNDGDSVRITLPFDKTTNILKASAFDLVEYIKVSLSDSSQLDIDRSLLGMQLQEADDVYYFVFFPDIDKAYKTINGYWKQQGAEKSESPSDLTTMDDMTSGDDDDDTQMDAAKPGLTTLGVENDNSKLAVPLYYIRALAHATHSTLCPDHQDNATMESTPHESSINKTIIHDSSGTHIPSKPLEQRANNMGTSPTASLAPDAERRGIEKPSRRNRSGSFKAIKHLATKPLQQLASRATSLPVTPSLKQTHTGATSSSAVKHLSIPVVTPHLSQLTSSLTLNRHKDMDQQTNPRKKDDLSSVPMWICSGLRGQVDAAIGSPSSGDTETDDMEEQYQSTLQEQLQRYFPMLGTNKDVIAVYKATLWRILPYYGRLYFTQDFACFHANILAGHQKIIIPYNDIASIRSPKKHGYYSLYNIGVTTRDMNEEILFDFSSLRLRDSCLALLSLKSPKQSICQLASDESKRHLPHSRRKSKDAHLEKKMATVHVTPPSKYGGPPVLTSLTKPDHHLPRNRRSSKPKIVTCLTIGSRGDVQPYIALCKQLQKNGAHHCRIATHEEYKQWIENHGIEFKSIGGNPEDLMKLCIENNFLSISFIKNGSKFFYTWLDTLLETAWEACQGTDVLIESPSAMVGIHFAEKLEIPYFRSMPFPWTRTTKFPHPFASSTISGGPIYNDMTYTLIDMAMWLGTSKPINRFRREKLGLAPTSLERLELSRVPCLYSFSSLIQPIPKDWPDYIHCTGYWFLDEHKVDTTRDYWQPPPELLSFLQLEDDPLDKKKDVRPVVYIGFGSIIVSDPDAMSRVIVDAVVEAGVRAIVCKGWSARNQDNQQQGKARSSHILQEHPDVILSLDSVPHDWLFPLIQGVVHHGGAGTCAAGLRAGLPTVIKPFFGDQRFWAQRIEAQGVGICMPKLTKAKLKDHLLTITQNQAMISKARLLGEAIRQENGTKTAVECLYRDMELAKRTQQMESSTEEKDDISDNSSNRTSLHAYVTKLKRVAP
ncbi:hypothetical protein BC941DRAFT_429665 [Chlamydoabsidia padenii]|nr:hypothetical protein BC941DRAFT_429665 [Chlamydoabsidia padenii]